MPLYRHTQVGKFALGLNLTILLLTGIPAVRTGQPALVVVALIVLVVAVLFGTLTVEVREDALHFRFGPGLVRRTIPIADIDTVAVERSKWYEGIGIRITSVGVMYNVAVGPVIEVRRRSGKRFRLGTDQPGALRDALERAIAARRGAVARA